MNSSTKVTNMFSSYDQTYFDELYQIEDRHFWFRTRRAIINALTEQIISSFSPGYRVLEIGCGTGNILHALETTCQQGIVVGLDLFWQGLAYARQRTQAGLIQARVECMPFVEEQFNLAGMFDVLEHLEQDELTLKSVNRILKPGGRLLLTVPARHDLWSFFDLTSHHQRRYEICELSEKLGKAGFSIDYISECMQALYPMAKIRQKAPQTLQELNSAEKEEIRHRGSRELAIIPVIHAIASQVLNWEINQIKKRKTITRGTSIIAIAVKE